MRDKYNIPTYVYSVPLIEELKILYPEADMETLWCMRRAWKRRRLRTKLSEAQNHRCCYCGINTQVCLKGRGKICTTIEHIVPRSRGGWTTFANCVIACSDCNGKRGNNITNEELDLRQDPNVITMYENLFDQALTRYPYLVYTNPVKKIDNSPNRRELTCIAA